LGGDAGWSRIVRVSGTDTSAPETVLPAADTALDLPARAFDRIVRSSDAHRAQLRTTIHRMGLSGRKRTLLVLGCGSGAPVQGVVDEAPGWKVVAVDESVELVGMARRLDWAPDYRFLHGTLGTLDDALRAEGIEPRFDGILVVFQMRHQRNLDDTLDYLLELLKPGAPLAVHEYSVRGDRAAQLRWAAACWLDYLPRIRMRGRVPGMASFLWHSVRRFDSATMFKERLEVAGFTDVRVQTVGGWQEHVLYTFLGRKPEDEDDEPLDELDSGDAGADSWADRGTDTPPAASAPVPPPRPSLADRPEWGRVPRRDDPADGADRGDRGDSADSADGGDRGEVFDLDEDETGYGTRGGDTVVVPGDDAAVVPDDDGPTSYADMDEFADNHDLDGTEYVDDPDDTVLFTHADPDAETPPAGLPVVEGERPGDREEDLADTHPARTATAEPGPTTTRRPSPVPRATEEPGAGATAPADRTVPAPPVEANAAARTEEADAPTVAEDADAGRTVEDEPEPAAKQDGLVEDGLVEDGLVEDGLVEDGASRTPARSRVRNLFRGPRRSSRPVEPAGSAWLRRAEREPVRTDDDEPDDRAGDKADDRAGE
jgi:ubiquinone/menaquinone biosynthesis C-methylase UbiE